MVLVELIQEAATLGAVTPRQRNSALRVFPEDSITDTKGALAA